MKGVPTPAVCRVDPFDILMAGSAGDQDPSASSGQAAELRSISTTIAGERFYIYAFKAKATVPVPIASDGLRARTPPA
jgi:hypothetical protein